MKEKITFGVLVCLSAVLPFLLSLLALDLDPQGMYSGDRIALIKFGLLNFSVLFLSSACIAAFIHILIGVFCKFIPAEKMKNVFLCSAIGLVSFVMTIILYFTRS